MAGCIRKKDPVTGRVMPEHVSYRHSDGRYIYRYSVKGLPKYLYARDLDEMKGKIEKLRVDVAQGMDVDMGKLRLADWFPQYMEHFKSRRLKASTYKVQWDFYNWYIKDSVVDRTKLSELKRIMLIRHFQELADKKGLAKGTLKSLASLLYNCLEQARFDGAITGANPATAVMREVVARPKETREALSKEEVRVLMEFLKIEGTWQNVYLPLVGVGISTGLRHGELMGLTWADVDYGKNVIHISHSVSYRNRGNGHEFFITGPKTENAYRDIPMTGEVREFLDMQREYQKSMGIRQDVTVDGYKGFLFTTKTGNVFTHEAVVRALKLIVKRCNEWEAERAAKENREPVTVREHTPHYWRHTFTTRLVEAKVPYEEAKLLLGHASVKTTIDIYTHISKEILKNSRNSLEGVIKLL